MRDLHSNLDEAQWAITGYLLALTLVLPTFRFVTERFGMKRVYVASLFGFTATSVLCAAAWSVPSLIAFRIAQGAIGGLLTPVAQALTARHASDRHMGRLLSIVAIPVLIAPVFGPLIGGFLVENLSWRAIFAVNVPFGVVGAYLCARVLPADDAPAPREQSQQLDVVGLSLLSPGMALAIYGITQLHRGAGTSVVVAMPFVLAAMLLVAFSLWARKRPLTALLDVRFFQRRTVIAALVTYILSSIASFGGQLIWPLYFQEVRGRSPLQAGVLLVAQGVGMIVTLPRIGTFTDRYDPGKLAMVGVALTLLGTVAFVVAGPDASLWLLSASLVVRGAGLGASNNPVLAAVYRALPKAEIANATTALNVVQRIGAPLGTATMAVLLQWRSAVEPLPLAFSHVFAVFVALNVVTLVPAAFLIKRVA